jgi:hypothetical protein
METAAMITSRTVHITRAITELIYIRNVANFLHEKVTFTLYLVKNCDITTYSE